MPSAPRGAGVERLTRKNLAGEVFTRLPDVEAQLVKTLNLSDKDLIAWAEAKSADNDVLKEESIAYLLRRAAREENHVLMRRLAEVLLKRSAANIFKKIGSLETVRDAYNDVVAELFGRLMDVKSDRADFFQVRFWPALEALAVDVYRRHRKELKKRRSEVELANPNSDAEHPLVSRQVSEDESAIGVDDLAACREGLSQLREPIRTAFVLHHYYDWQIESKDPKEKTISGYFDKSPRTIRMWLADALEVLNKWRGEKK